MNESIKTQPLEIHRTLLVIVFLAVAAWYFTWRLGSFNPQAKIFSYVLYAAEIYGLITVLLHLFMTWRLTVRTPPSPPESGISVDIFVTTINEPLDLVRRTLLSALNVEYPHQTWVLDDGQRPEMAALAGELGVRYLTRGDNKNFKAGSLNNALKNSNADFIAVFDADHAPHKNFLSNTLGYFKDPAVAFVQTPQDFFNLDSYQHRQRHHSRAVWTEQSLFFRVILRGKDAWNAAFFCGSCAVLRRSALDAIGGFATGSVTEDLHTSIRIHKRGFKSVYHAESLAFGLAPVSIGPFLKQRVRWGQGAMQVWRKEGILFTHGLTFAQRLNYFASALTYFDGWQKAFFYIAPALVLLTGVMPIKAFNIEFLIHFVPYFLLTFWVFEETGRGFGRSILIEQYNMARFAAFIWATFGLFRKKLQFWVSPKAEREAEIDRYVAPQFGVLMLNGLAIPIGIILYSAHHHLPIGGFIANIVWASANSVITLMILLFTRRCASYQRSDYRFPIPMPGKFKLPRQPEYFVTVDDISSSGCRMYGPFTEQLRRGETFEATIFLPSGPVTVKGQIAIALENHNAAGKYIKAIGCHFEWADTAQRDALDTFLYGTDLQWQLLQLSESIKTPMQRIGALFRRRKSLPRYTPNHWATILYKPYETTDENFKVGLVSISDSRNEPRYVLVFEPLPKHIKLIARMFTRTGEALLDMRNLKEAFLRDTTTPIFVYQIEKVKTQEIQQTAFTRYATIGQT